MSATKRVQFLDYNLIRSGRLTPNEHALLAIIGSFSQRCEMSQDYLARAMNRSISTVRRTLNALISKGFIRRRYTVFKRCVLQIVDLKEQKQLMTAQGIVKQALKTLKNRVKSNDRSSVSELNRSSVSEPTRNETTRNKTDENELNLMKKTFEKAAKMNERTFNNERNRQLAMFREKFGFLNA